MLQFINSFCTNIKFKNNNKKLVPHPNKTVNHSSLSHK